MWKTIILDWIQLCQMAVQNSAMKGMGELQEDVNVKHKSFIGVLKVTHAASNVWDLIHFSSYCGSLLQNAHPKMSSCYKCRCLGFCSQLLRPDYIYLCLNRFKVSSKFLSRITSLGLLQKGLLMQVANFWIVPRKAVAGKNELKGNFQKVSILVLDAVCMR